MTDLPDGNQPSSPAHRPLTPQTVARVLSCALLGRLERVLVRSPSLVTAFTDRISFMMNLDCFFTRLLV
jgi:hypothetical protein